jgi:ketosteroid isomerase-like protein
MVDESKRDRVAAALGRINRAWLDGRVEDLAPMVHADIVMAFPGFTARTQGREEFVAGFRDFCRKATIGEFHEHDRHVDVAGDTAVVTFRYEMVYDRSGERYRATGRDLWVFQLHAGEWLAVWRTMLDLEENAA